MRMYGAFVVTRRAVLTNDSGDTGDTGDNNTGAASTGSTVDMGSAAVNEPEHIPRHPEHERAVAALRASYQRIPAGAPVRLAKRTSNLFRFGPAGSQPG